MAWEITSAAMAVELVVAVSCLTMGVSHLVRPTMWAEFFGFLHRAGERGVIARSFIEIWPAVIIVTLHPVWSGAGLVVTLYGWALLIKVSVSLVAPQIGLRSLAMAHGGSRRFIGAGVGLIVVAGAAGLAVAGV